MDRNERLAIAVQKSGRLAENSLELLRKCGISLTKSKDQLFCKSYNFPLDVYFVRDDDIPAFVSSKVCQIGIVGQNVLAEQQAVSDSGAMADLETVLELGFGRCRLSLAVPQDMDYAGIASLSGQAIATSYRGILRKYLQDQKVQARIVNMKGAVEVAPRTHLADAICDLVSTGATLASNGLKEVETVMESQAVLIRGTDIGRAQEDILARLLMRIQGVRRAEASKYIMLHCPVNRLEEIKAALPGSEAPTIVPLQGVTDRVAVHAVCDEAVFWDVMEDLQAKGASAMLVLPIEKMLP